MSEQMHEPQQPGEREVEDLARVLYVTAEGDSWDVLMVGARRPFSVEHRVADLYRRSARAALAHLAERRAGDAEAVAKVLAEHYEMHAGGASAPGRWFCECGEEIGLGPGMDDLFRRHIAAQITALTPTRRWDQRTDGRPITAAERDERVAWDNAHAEVQGVSAEQAWKEGAQAAYDSMETTPIGVRFNKLHNPYREEVRDGE